MKDRAISLNAVIDALHQSINLFEAEDRIRDLPPVKPQYTDDEIQKMQDLEQAEIQKAYELGKAEAQKWIPVSEPPKKEGEYLVTLRYLTHNGVNTACYSKNLFKVNEYDFYGKRHKAGWYNYDSEYGYYEETNVVAWQALPKPYEPQERSEE